MPVAVAHNQFLGAGLAGLGVVLGIFGMFMAVLRRRGAGFGLSFGGTAVCGSVLFAGIWLIAKGVLPFDAPRAQTDTAKQDHGDTGSVAKKDSGKRAGVPPLKGAGGGKWLSLTEEERARWKRVRNRVRQQFEAAVRREADPTDTLLSGGILVPGASPEETRRQEEKAKKKVAEWQRKRLEAARGRRLQYLAYSTKTKAWAAVSIVTTVTNAGLQERPVLGPGLPRDRDERFGPDIVFTTYLMDDEGTAHRRAAALAALPDVRCVAVVVLYSADDPSLVAWAHDDGGGARMGAEAPFPELLDGLRQFVHRLQTTAD